MLALQTLRVLVDRQKAHFDPILSNDQCLTIRIQTVELLPAVAAPARRPEQLVLDIESHRARRRIKALTE
jgi:hypothetical protein